MGIFFPFKYKDFNTIVTMFSLLQASHELKLKSKDSIGIFGTVKKG